MKLKTFIDELKAQGVQVVNGKRHYKLYYGDKWTTCARHPAQEISNICMNNVKKQLGLK